MVRDIPSEVIAVLTALGECPASFDVSIVAREGRRITLANAPALPVGSPVKAEAGDTMWLGEVLSCEPGGILVMSVMHTLGNLRELSRLADLFSGKRAPNAEQTVPAHRDSVTLS